MEGRDGKTTDASRYVISLKSDQRVGRQSVDSQPADCRPTVDRRVGRRVYRRVGGIGFFTISLSLL